MQTRNSNGQYDRSKLYNKIAFWLILTVVGTLCALYTFRMTEHDNEITVTNPISAVIAHADTVTPSIEAKIDELKANLVKEMVACENPTGIPAINDNNKAGTLNKRDAVSYGPLMYKIGTLQWHYKKLYGKDLTDIEAARFAMSDDIKPFVIRVWLEIPGSINAWSCATPEMKRTVEDIRFLTN